MRRASNSNTSYQNEYNLQNKKLEWVKPLNTNEASWSGFCRQFYSLGIATVVPKDYKYFWWVNCFWELGSLPSNVHFLSSPSHLGFLPSGFDGMAWQWRLWQASPAFAVINQIIGTVEVTNTDGWWTPKTVKNLDGWWFLPEQKRVVCLKWSMELEEEILLFPSLVLESAVKC